VGSIIGYEVSNAFAEPDSGPAPGKLGSAAGVQLVPVVAPTLEGGLLVGLVGRF
jgi:hypothetical protein